jgi:hypothetical protein
MAMAAALLRDVDSSTERYLDRARAERCFRRGGVRQVSAGRPQLELSECDQWILNFDVMVTLNAAPAEVASAAGAHA